MPNLLDTLEALERQATPGPWVPFVFSSRPYHISVLMEAEDDESASSYVEVASGNSASNLRLIAAARNAFPALLRVARAVREWEEAQRVYTGLFESSAYEGGMGGAERRLDQAEDDLRAALAALDAAGERESEDA